MPTGRAEAVPLCRRGLSSWRDLWRVGRPTRTARGKSAPFSTPLSLRTCVLGSCLSQVQNGTSTSPTGLRSSSNVMRVGVDLSAPARQFIIERDGGRCGVCHSPGCEIGQITGDPSDPDALRLLCHSCRARSSAARRDHCDTRTEAHISVLFSRLTHRIDAAAPTRACKAISVAL